MEVEDKGIVVHATVNIDDTRRPVEAGVVPLTKIGP